MTAVDFAAFVEQLAQVSGEVILPFFRSAIGAEDKSRGGVFDPVTEADRAAESAMRRQIAQTFPAHGVIGEEYGQDRPDAEYVWVLDPIDGTKSFISGLPTWGTLIGLMHNGLPVYGMMSQPFTRERYFGDGKRARLRSLAPTRGDGPPGEWATRTLRTRTCASLDRATVMTTPASHQGRRRPRRLS
jgi:fructose-1,6-bisphosphatase/inositol monophosphatase family enzyme